MWTRSYFVDEVYVIKGNSLAGTVFPNEGIICLKFTPHQNGVVRVHVDHLHGRVVDGYFARFQFTKYFAFELEDERVEWVFDPSFKGDGTSFGYYDKVKPLVFFPFWFLVIIFAVYPSLLLIPIVRRVRRSRKGLCLYCGYNLTGNVTGVCPECGTRIKDGPLVSSKSDR